MIEKKNKLYYGPKLDLQQVMKEMVNRLYIITFQAREIGKKAQNM